MEEEKLTIRVELMDIVESKLGIKLGVKTTFIFLFIILLCLWKWVRQNWMMDFQKQVNFFTIYIMQYGTDYII